MSRIRPLLAVAAAFAVLLALPTVTPAKSGKTYLKKGKWTWQNFKGGFKVAAKGGKISGINYLTTTSERSGCPTVPTKITVVGSVAQKWAPNPDAPHQWLVGHGFGKGEPKYRAYFNVKPLAVKIKLGSDPTPVKGFVSMIFATQHTSSDYTASSIAITFGDCALYPTYAQPAK